jgi:hypothetical protein
LRNLAQSVIAGTSSQPSSKDLFTFVTAQIVGQRPIKSAIRELDAANAVA